jgi:hypothetical protein
MHWCCRPWIREGFHGKAMTDSKRQAHSKVVEMVLKSKKPNESAPDICSVAVIGS